MKTTSTLPEKTIISSCIDIKKYSLNKIKVRSAAFDSKSDVQSDGEKALVIDMFQNTVTGKAKRIKLIYTIQPGDHKRLNKNGILRVYNFNEPVDIPVTSLLGEWKKTHINVTLVVINDKWCVEGGVIVQTSQKQQTNFFTAFQQLLKYVVTL